MHADSSGFKMTTVLEDFGLLPEVETGVLKVIWGNDTPDTSPTASLKKWLSLLPPPISGQITLAINQERPFMPPDVTPEMMANANEVVPSMNNIAIIYRCIDFALKAGDYQMAAALAYVVDRACYRFGRSTALLRVVQQIKSSSPDTPVAPQVILRQARVMKDSGDLHTAMRVLNAVITGEQKWDYKDEEQFENTKAVCVQIKGQILHNLGLWKEAVPPLVESVRSFSRVSDNKGMSSSLALLSRCLKKIDLHDYQNMQGYFQDMFSSFHPFYEAYLQATQAVRLIEDLGTTVYLAHNQLVADESLLMFTVQHTDMPEKQKLDQLQVIVKEMKQSLSTHRTVQYMQSREVYLVFVRAVFIIGLTLTFSPISQDGDLARFLEKLSLEMYAFMCQQLFGSRDNDNPSSLRQNGHSVGRMNAALALLGLPVLEGTTGEEEKEGQIKWSDVQETAKHTASVSLTSSLPGQTGSQSSVPSTSESPFSCHLEESSDQQRDYVKDKRLAANAATFPALNPRTSQPVGRHLPTHSQKFVGLNMSRECILASTCPAQAENAVDSDGYNDLVDVDSLIVSADSVKSASTSLTAEDVPSAATQSSSDDPKRSDVATVDQSASTDLSSSATTESSEFSSSSSSRHRSVGSSGVTSFVTETDSSGKSNKSDTVDQSADTVPSSPSGTSDAEGSSFSALVDVSSASALMAGLHLGSSVETSDSGEFLAHFIPSENKDVHKAVIMTYNPVTGKWTAQTTLAYVGPLLEVNAKGTLRDAIHVSYLHQDEPLGRYVGKRYRNHRRSPYVYMQDVVCQMLAGFYVTRFNQALQQCSLDIFQVQFLTAAHLQLLDKDDKVFDWLNVEPFLHGSFLKLTNNLRYVSKAEKSERAVEVATALSHFSFAETRGTLMMVDLQGWMPTDRKGVVYLTDPVFHTKNMKQFSSGDHHEKGMQAFWTNQHPQCNRICKFLGLENVRP